MSNHPGHDTLTSQILFIFSLFVDCWNDQSLKISVLNSLNFQSYWDLEMWLKWLFRGKIHHYEFSFSVITIVLVILSSWNLVWVSFFGLRNSERTLWRLKPVLRYIRFQILGTCDQIDAKNYMWLDRSLEKNFLFL